MAIENWEPTEEERASLLKALDRVWGLAWTPAELAPILKMRDILTIGGGVTLWYDGPVDFSTPSEPFRGPAGAAVREKIAAAQAANLKSSGATIEVMVMKFVPSSELYILRVAHGGEANGDVSILTGYRGPLSEYQAMNLPLLVEKIQLEDFDETPGVLRWLDLQVENGKMTRLDAVS
jgi:hypothetical protein